MVGRGSELRQTNITLQWMSSPKCILISWNRMNGSKMKVRGDIFDRVTQHNVQEQQLQQTCTVTSLVYFVQLRCSSSAVSFSFSILFWRAPVICRRCTTYTQWISWQCHEQTYVHTQHPPYILVIQERVKLTALSDDWVSKKDRSIGSPTNTVNFCKEQTGQNAVHIVRLYRSHETQYVAACCCVLKVKSF